MSTLVIIEAPGKIATLGKSLREVFPGVSFQILATGGQVKDLPVNELGVDPILLEPKNEVLSGPGQSLENIIDHSLKKNGQACWEEILVATDPDREGEGIADHVWHMLKQRHLEHIAKRVSLEDLSTDGLRSAKVTAAPDQGVVAARTARRVIDRIIPRAVGLFSKIGEWRGLGRVQLAACRVIDEKTRDWKPFRVVGQPWPSRRGFSVDIRCSDPGEAEVICRLLEQKSTVISKATVQVVEPPVPHHAGTLLANLPGMMPERVHMAAQESYIAGRLSYPRTDSTHFSTDVRHRVARVAGDLLLTSRFRDHWSEEDEGTRSLHVQGAHPGLHPVVDFLATPPVGLSPEARRVELEVAARAMASMMTPAILGVETVQVDKNIVATRIQVEDPGWLMAYERLGIAWPLNTDPGPKLRIEESWPDRRDVVSWLVEAGLGRPSTLAFIPERLVDNGLLSTRCLLTAKGKQWLDRVSEKFPMITSPAFTRDVEQILDSLTQDPTRYLARVQEILNKGGIDTLALPMVDDAIKTSGPRITAARPNQ